MNKVTKRCINETAEELNMSIAKVELAVEMVYKFYKELVQNNEHKDLYIKYFGTFKYNAKQQEKINKLSNGSKRAKSSRDQD